jgi:hypothetical protein
MVAIDEQPPAAPQRSIDGSRHAHREALHAQRQSAAVLCLHDQVQVMALHREMYEAKPEALSACGQRETHFSEEAALSQRWDTGGKPKRNVRRMMARQ